ncbi:low molecular weight protein arginine phosphatase [Ureibacillus sp. FSL K6-8385]|uniref:Low molecular weight protein arginine phosphatase n=1 Tax=Ureibacillus terrenus TaxID=118246 RepID=A0A540V2C3_9BACL|nr:low molecular weight protein arginine phosphatase [Ureibacillus terrenus]MED3661369.1 low molecular weight protein arginine phosphatase [Ureibacillus terrenus]MED3764160.1 low molecular weight protein arginine phosphatase [Ureibacillus terrenus]TQE90886.1 low molecular weight protein arginine phosphatase [Ureibacillus terrenus]
MNIYFVCTGNTCRSPMAEAILKHKNIEGIEVKSAGIFALEGGKISEHSKTVLEQENIDFEHTTRQVNEKDIEWADLILTMTAAHRDMILQFYQNAKGKTYTLKEYVMPYSSPDVSDPYGGDLDTYKNTYNELNRLIDELVKKITEGGREKDEEQSV